MADSSLIRAGPNSGVMAGRRALGLVCRHVLSSTWAEIMRQGP